MHGKGIRLLSLLLCLCLCAGCAASPAEDTETPVPPPAQEDPEPEPEPEAPAEPAPPVKPESQTESETAPPPEPEPEPEPETPEQRKIRKRINRLNRIFATLNLEGQRRVIELAKDLKVPFTVHAGESASYESIKSAVEMGATRIGHGVRALESK